MLAATATVHLASEYPSHSVQCSRIRALLINNLELCRTSLGAQSAGALGSEDGLPGARHRCRRPSGTDHLSRVRDTATRSSNQIQCRLRMWWCSVALYYALMDTQTCIYEHGLRGCSRVPHLHVRALQTLGAGRKAPDGAGAGQDAQIAGTQHDRL